MKRKVKIQLSSKPHPEVWMVKYVDRKKYQKHLAATFDAHDWDLARVTTWIKSNPNLELAEPYEGPGP
jgi:hypothetical protein